MAQIFCFGDSITYGYKDQTLGGWTNRLKLYLENSDNFKGLIYNLGVPGETTDRLIERFTLETISRLNEVREERKNDNVFIFAYGANDSAIMPSRSSFRVDVDTFKSNLIKVVIEAKKFGGKIYIQTITPVIEEITISSLVKDKSRSNEYIKKYNNKIIEVSKEQNIEVIDVNSAYLKQGYHDLFCEDGLHPNDKGHELIFKTVIEKIV
jgi:lysophospholipase L1-like esterase